MRHGRQHGEHRHGQCDHRNSSRQWSTARREQLTATPGDGQDELLRALKKGRSKGDPHSGQRGPDPWQTGLGWDLRSRCKRRRDAEADSDRDRRVMRLREIGNSARLDDYPFTFIDSPNKYARRGQDAVPRSLNSRRTPIDRFRTIDRAGALQKIHVENRHDLPFPPSQGIFMNLFPTRGQTLHS